MGLGDRVLEKFGIRNKDGEIELPEDVGCCPFCGYIGHEFVDNTCPKCKERLPFPSKEEQEKSVEELESGVTSSQLEGLFKGRRTSWNNKDIKGTIGEMYFANKLRNDGFLVKRTMIYDFETGKSIFNENGIKDLLSSLKNKNEIDKIYALLKQFGNGYPDLICLKQDKTSFFEVKTNDSELKQNQQNVAKCLREAGFDVSVIRLEVDFNVKETDEK